MDAVRAVWPYKYPLNTRVGSDDLNPAGTRFDDAVEAVKMMKDHGLDLANLSPTASGGAPAAQRQRSENPCAPQTAERWRPAPASQAADA